jgi:hypothetical protein
MSSYKKRDDDAIFQGIVTTVVVYFVLLIADAVILFMFGNNDWHADWVKCLLLVSPIFVLWHLGAFESDFSNDGFANYLVMTLFSTMCATLLYHT